MIHKDFLEEAIKKFVEGVSKPLEYALLKKDITHLGDVDAAIAELLEMNSAVVMQLAPASLVTMMKLSQVSAAIAQYVSYVLRLEARAYQSAQHDELSSLRLNQALAIEEAFDCESDTIPPEFSDLNTKLG